MTATLQLNGREAAYLLGSVGGMLLMPTLPAQHRVPLVQLRDRLLPLVPVDSELRQALGLEPGS